MFWKKLQKPIYQNFWGGVLVRMSLCKCSLGDFKYAWSIELDLCIWHCFFVTSAFFEASCRIWHGRKVRPNPLTLGPLGPPVIQAPAGSLGPLWPPGAQDFQCLRIPWSPGTPKTSGLLEPLGAKDLRTLGKWPLPFAFEIRNLNTEQLFLICCKKYRHEVSHRYGSVAFLKKV